MRANYKLVQLDPNHLLRLAPEAPKNHLATYLTMSNFFQSLSLLS